MLTNRKISRPRLDRTDKIAPWLALVVAFLAGNFALENSSPLLAADRTTLFVPLPSDAETATSPKDAQAVDLEGSLFPDQAMGAAASDGWKAYMRLWKAHHADPVNPEIRRFLGLPKKKSCHVRTKAGRAAPKSLRWAAGSYLQVDTPHFTIFSRASEPTGRFVAEDLEQSYWVWTQLFFPLWEAAAQVSLALGDMPEDETVQDYLSGSAARISTARRMRVVLFKDAAEYQQTLAREIRGAARSTGYYDNFKRTIYLYAASPDDGATRRHELVHQMFREATRSGLRNKMPAEKAGFWLIEGIAGYFESLWFDQRLATVGGWDASRLQFARFRVLANGDEMPISELRADGFAAAQKRPDLARWYAHAITQTHHLIDGGDLASRRAIYCELAKLYKIRVELPCIDSDTAFDAADRTTRKFLSIHDDHLVANPTRRSLQRLVLAGCQLTANGLRRIPPSAELQWLDLAGAPIGNADVTRLAPNPVSLRQLRLERTRIDADLLGWLSEATHLRELDLSSTRVNDTVIASLAAPNLTVLWLTGATVTDACVDGIAKMKNLESVDLQKTQVTPRGLDRLRSARPKLRINPLQVN